MEYYPALKNNDILIHATTWMDFEKNARIKPDTNRKLLNDAIYTRYLYQ